MFNRDTQAKLNVIFYFFVCLFGFAFFYLCFDIIGKKNVEWRWKISTFKDMPHKPCNMAMVRHPHLVNVMFAKHCEMQPSFV